jgi:GAF domain-containing protein
MQQKAAKVASDKGGRLVKISWQFSVPDPNATIDESIASICNQAEALAPETKTGVCIASADRSVLRRALFPNVPVSFQSCIKEIPMDPPYFGACNAVIRDGVVVTCDDLTKESRFHPNFVSLCVQHGIASLQSRPVFGRDEKPIGTFVMACSQPRAENSFDAALMRFAADAVGSVLQRELDRIERQ